MYAIIENEKVVNIVVASAEYAQQKAWIELEEGFGIGDLYIEGEFVKAPEPEPYVPEQVSRAQGKAALILAGTWDAVIQYVEEIEDSTTKLLAETALYDTQEWRRDSPFLVECATALGMSSEDLDALFIAAEEIVL